jgi:hypothetical protein
VNVDGINMTTGGNFLIKSPYKILKIYKIQIFSLNSTLLPKIQILAVDFIGSMVLKLIIVSLHVDPMVIRKSDPCHPSETKLFENN